MSQSRRLLLALSAVLALVLTGCGGIPSTGPVVEGRRLDEPIVDPQIRVVPQLPFAGATQEQIALGFLRSAEDVDETRATGKSYLAPASVDLWRWTSRDVVIYNSPDDLTIRTVAPDTLEVRARAVAKVSPDGRYSELPDGSQVSATFGMTRVNGEWRVELPSTGFGLWLDSAGFDRLYTAENLYYITKTGRRLVPDTRWFPSGSRMATTLARAQLDPPPQYLGGALTTGIPRNTTLAVNAVPIENGRAKVTLSDQALDADPQDRTAMWAQLAATLSQVSAVQTVSISAGGTDLELPSFGTAVSAYADLGYERTSTPTFDTALVRARNGRITRIDTRYVPDPTGNRRRPDTKLRDGDPVQIQSTWVRPGMSVDGQEVAAIGDTRTDLSRWRGTDFVAVKPFASQLTRPVYDSAGYLWVGGRAPDGTGRLYVLYAGGEKLADTPPQPVSAPWLVDRRVVAVAVAADAARLLVVTTNRQGTDARLGLAGIVRSTNGSPTAVEEPLRLGAPLTDIDDVVWLDEGSFAVIGRIGSSDPLRPWLGEVGAGLTGIRRQGPLSSEAARVAPLPRGVPVSVTSVGGARELIVVSDQGEVWVRAGATWRRIGVGSDVIVPGR